MNRKYTQHFIFIKIYMFLFNNIFGCELDLSYSFIHKFMLNYEMFVDVKDLWCKWVWVCMWERERGGEFMCVHFVLVVCDADASASASAVVEVFKLIAVDCLYLQYLT